MARRKLRERREELGYSQESLARAIGAETTTVRRWESGSTSPQPLLRRRLARELKVSPETLTELLADDEAKHTPSLESRTKGDGDMRRRTFLAGIPLLATAMTPNSLGSLEVEVSRLWSCYQDSRYQPIIDRMPGLLSQLQSQLLSGPTADRRRCENALAFAYQLSATTLTKLGHRDPAMGALDHGIAAAERGENLIVASSIRRSKAHALLAFGLPSVAAELVEETIRELASAHVLESPNSVSILGTLHLVGAVAAAQEGDARRALASLDAADEAAARLGRDANCLWTAFGPSNVAIHRVVADIELGRLRNAIDFAPSIDARSLPSERQARHAIEVARAHTMLGQIDEAAGALLDAEAMAAEQVRNHRLSRQLVASWLEQPRHREAVSSLAERMRIESD
ncbi:helix-turn-helix domain-containing protein [Glycomyces buryatensis]|uniref:Helix-turn-helix domain-containing protein n=1 Tax=Glycomyces buryatensis TaxID=2570927 RepID=A0A4S8QBW2_9ACTN|nr:helix-turn-helix domain-containing protein [Glycomyces buryatensis]THV42023.1 helix-turn-helix domain-containing protein [Glycomyces buryatensis]